MTYIRKIILFCLISILLCASFVFERNVMLWIARIQKFRVVVIFIILWYSFKYFLIGFLFSILFLIISYFFFSRILAFIVLLEAKLKVSRFVYIEQFSKMSLYSYLKFAYILYGLIPLLIRIFSTIPTEIDILALYLLIVNVVIMFAPYIIPIMAMIILPMVIIREKSKIRRVGMNFCLSYPSRILDAFLILFIGVGSITALVPLFFELLNIFQDFLLALELFIDAILLGYLPALSFVIGMQIGILIIGQRYMDESVKKFEEIVKRNIKLPVISIRL